MCRSVIELNQCKHGHVFAQMFRYNWKACEEYNQLKRTVHLSCRNIQYFSGYIGLIGITSITTGTHLWPVQHFNTILDHYWKLGYDSNINSKCRMSIYRLTHNTHEHTQYNKPTGTSKLKQNSAYFEWLNSINQRMNSVRLESPRPYMHIQDNAPNRLSTS